MSLHIYRARGMSLTKEHRCPWIIKGFKTPAFKPGALLWADCCSKRRPAKNLWAQWYYDGHYFWCSPDKGCKSEVKLRRDAKRDKQRRSIAAKAGWKTRRSLPISRPNGETP